MLLSWIREYFAKSDEPFAVQVAGERLVIITNPHDVAHFYKNSAALTFDIFTRTIHQNVAQISDEGYSTLWKAVSEGYESLFPNPEDKPLAFAVYRVFHRQVLGGEPLEEITRTFVGHLEPSMRFNHLSKDWILASRDNERVISLSRWALESINDAATDTFFGVSLRKLLPSITQVFNQYDQNSWMLLYKYPEFLAKAATRPRDKLVATFFEYFNLPDEEIKDSNKFVTEHREEHRHAGLSDEDSAKIMFLLYWAINGNAQKCAFWLLAYALQRPALFESLRDEIKPAIQRNTSEKRSESSSAATVDYQYLLDSCPLLNGAFNETLRITSTSLGVREVVSPVRLGGKLITPGAKVMVPHRVLLLAEEGFGSDSLEWSPERWLDDKKLERSGYYHPFGGGATLCSGRFIARREVLTFVAIALAKYNLTVVPPDQEVLGIRGRPFPTPDTSRPSLALMPPGLEDDVILRVTER